MTTSESKQVRYLLDEDVLNYISDYKDKHNFKRDNVALQSIINEHKKLSNQLFDLEYIVTRLKQEVLFEINNSVQNAVSDELKRIRLGTNNADRNTQILIELLQGFIVADNKETLTTTDIFKPPFLSEAEEVVQERINNFMLKKRSQSEKGDNQ
jgi:hypothetical protein